MYGFSTISGNKRLLASLQKRLEHTSLPHAALFYGGQGTGKTLIATTFAKAINCKYRPSTCLGCASCAEQEAGTNPDIRIINKGSGKSISVETTREAMVAEAAFRPYRHSHKIFIIEEAANMLPPAQNALLKTLEEPPEYAIFLLTTSRPELLLPTVRSRCLQYRTSAVGDSDVVLALSQIHPGIPMDEAALIASLAQGSIGHALTLAGDDEFRKLHTHTTQLAQEISELNLLEVFAQTKALEAFKHRIEDFLDIAHAHYCAALIRPQLKHHTGILDKNLTLSKLDAINNAKERLRANGNFQIVMDSLLLKLHGKLI